MLALSIHQPWAHAILHLGKSVENRTWSTPYRGPLLIHAAKSRASYDCWTPKRWQEGFLCELPPWESLAKGAIVGRVELVDCVRVDPGRPGFLPGVGPNVWVEGPVCWVLRNPVAFEVPVPYRGMQQLFEVPDDLLRISESRVPTLFLDPAAR